MIFNEAEDFTVTWGARDLGRFMVNSIEPYELDLNAEYIKDNYDIYYTIKRLLDEGRIVEYKPNYTISASMFDDEDLHIVKNNE